MLQSNIVKLSLRGFHPPVCGKCGCTMWIVSRVRKRSGEEQQTFECPCCPQEENWPAAREA